VVEQSRALQILQRQVVVVVPTQTHAMPLREEEPQSLQHPVEEETVAVVTDSVEEENETFL
jgi:hypothetical protein